MSLAVYRRKRRFDRTPEPKARVAPKAQAGLGFVIQKHDASRLHYDFRLEIDGVLKSWAVPKGPSLNPSHKSLAVQVEDHPLDYRDFEGVIPKGEYGGGTVLLWDSGTWEPLHDPLEGLKKGMLHFKLDGHKLHGEWTLVQMHGKASNEGKNWLLIKVKDQYASTGKDILADDPRSVKTSRSLEEIAGARDRVWSKDAKVIGKLQGAIKSAFPATISPQLAVLADAPPSGRNWLHEIKYDGYRFIARLKSGKVQLLTRNGKDWTDKFAVIAKSLVKLKADSAILDGEIVVLNEKGQSDFQALQAMLKRTEPAHPTYYAFDLLFCDGFDLRHVALLTRKKELERILKESDLGPVVQYSDHLEGDGSSVVRKACEMQLEGIISKQADAEYVSRRDPSWLKSKCGQRQELVVIGYTDPKGSRAGFGSLLLGYHDSRNRLIYAGRVGTGFDDKLLKKSLKELEDLKQADAPTDVDPPAREKRDAHWVKPKLVAEVKFTGWTREGVLRHPAFVAFRTDKPAAQIVREMPIQTKPAKPAPSRRQANTTRTKPVRVPRSEPPVQLTHPDKVLYPDTGTTKQDLADYYALVREWMLGHVIGRPLALVRCPSGTSSKCFFQRNWSDTMPAVIGKVAVGEGKKKETHVTVNDLSGVLSMVQMGVLEIHTWNCRNEDIERPDQLVFDLDPGPDLPWKRVVEAARRVRRTLESLHLPTFLKTSGGKGLHLTTPIKPEIDWGAAKSFCQTIAQSLAKDSDLFVANMRKDLRGGKVYIDYNRNGRGATAVAPYSTRARAGAPVSMPISWDELGKLKSADQFTVANASKYLNKRRADPWADFEEVRVDLHSAMKSTPDQKKDSDGSPNLDRFH